MPRESAAPKPHILGLSREALQTELAHLGAPPYRAQQVHEWLYRQHVVDPRQMRTLPQTLRAQLAEAFATELPQLDSRVDSADGASKLLLNVGGRLRTEAVILRYEGRTSLCVSSQVGCRLACRFCQTGKLGFVRHLSAAEILGQVVLANQLLREEQRRVTHVVFMGMGEPFDNFEATIFSTERLTSPDHFGLSHRHVTLSTSGVVPRIYDLAERNVGSLAVSLHAARDELRTQLMPINKRYPLAQLKAALVHYQRTTGKKVTIEYILIRETTCGMREARDLVRFLQGLRAKVNLIPFNAHPGLPYERPSDPEIRRFQEHLAKRSIPAPVRYSKGPEISAACGQLAAKTTTGLHAPPVRRTLLGERDSIAR